LVVIRVPCFLALCGPLLLPLLATGCNSSFDPYNELKTLRVLAIRASPPTLTRGTTTTMDALVYTPDGDEPRYSWSWCPLRFGSENNYQCALSLAAFKSQVDSVGADSGSVTYDLGSDSTAIFGYLFDASVLAALCVANSSVDAGTTTSVCDQGFPIEIALTVEDGQHSVAAFKTIYLAVDASASPNTNPSIHALSIASKDATRDSATLLSADGATYDVQFGGDYELFAEVPSEASESYVYVALPGAAPSEQRETLTVTWFITAGSTDNQRTTFYDGRVGLEVLTHNTWMLPQPEEFHADHAVVFTVLRDNRGGVDWLQREVLVGSSSPQNGTQQ
jgi:hypothetical protein